MPPAPPSFLERLVGALLGDDPSTPYVIGDLREEYRARTRGPLAWIWYASQGLRLAFRVRWERRRRATLPPGDRMTTDLRQALRFLRRRPAFTGAIVLTVALSIAATTLAFTVVNGVLLEPLPYATPERLVAVWEMNPRGNPRNVASPANYLTWKDELGSFEAVAALLESSTTMLGEGDPERIGWMMASGAYFEAVGAEPLIGRLYTEEEDVGGTRDVVVLSESFWRRRFGADPAVLGRTLTTGELGTFTIIGVLPERFDFEVEQSFSGLGSHDIWFPPAFPPEARQASGRYLQVIARLAPGASLESARDEASALAARLADMYPDRQRGWEINVVPLQEDMVGDASTTILVVFGAVCLVLLIACANVANLLMTRASERQQEMAVRSALGAGRGHLVQQLLVESALLSVTGGLVGLLLAQQGVAALVASAPDIPRIEEIGIDATVIGFALLATVGTTLLFGLAPSLSLVRGSAASWLGARGTGARREAQRLRAGLVIAQVSLSLVLLVGAGLLVRSLLNRLDVGAGFDVEGLLTTDVQLGAREPEEQRAFFEELVDRASAVPGVRAASAITWPPLAGGGTRTSFWRLDRPVPEAGRLPGADIRWVQRDYHDVLSIPLLAGRLLNEDDRADAPLVVLVNETGAERIWPGESPLGKRIAMPWGDTLLAEVVGVVGDIRHDGPDTEPYPMFYYDHRQHHPFNLMSLVVRTAPGVAATTVVPGLRAALAELDPSLPLWNVRTMEELFADSIKRSRLATVALGVFALLALLLAAIGIYGVMAHATERRTQEIGIRMALGAARPSILGMVIGQGMVQVAIALALGAAGAFALSRLLQGLVFGVSTTDPLTFGAMVALLAAVGFVACWLPARRASGLDPVQSIRSD